MKHLFFAFLLFVSASVAAQTGGIYLPSVISSKNAGNPIPQPAMYIKNDSIVIVYGHIFVNGFPTVGTRSDIVITLPVSSPIPPPFIAYGIGEVNQSNQAQAIMALLQTNVDNQIQIFWTPTQPFPANITFSFSYIIHN